MSEYDKIEQLLAENAVLRSDLSKLAASIGYLINAAIAMAKFAKMDGECRSDAYTMIELSKSSLLNTRCVEQAKMVLSTERN